ncbi:hypothetical protein HJC23_008095 [Cyclotella cryptica]|uniref:Metallo-beta-lactamase domain-containing protein n=1 Tax=Cyclotella cryptica TaxID=29204 RepID=A0ABD3PGK3_9STRA|eukprot:CCRYP_015000-RA/>CCRYP_015000-RA protein AED:0.04 eAED:0.04 QI:257/-1/1/1/-1/1/1/130/391
MRFILPKRSPRDNLFLRASSVVIAPSHHHHHHHRALRSGSHKNNHCSSYYSSPLLNRVVSRRISFSSGPVANNFATAATATATNCLSSRRLVHRQSTMSFRPLVHGLYHADTSTVTYIISDPASLDTIILDSVMDYDSASGCSSDEHNELVVAYCEEHKLNVRYILESHVHADHLTGAQYLKSKYPDAKTGIGANVTTVQQTFAKIFNYSPQQLATDGSQFDLLFQDGDTFLLGDHPVSVIHTPGHTPACVCYVAGDAVFTGDTIFMPDFGTARCDFPGGSSAELYASVKKLYDTLPEETRVYVGHDYQPGGRDILFQTSIAEEKTQNIQLKGDTSGEEFSVWRSERDGKLGMPKLILPGLQVNLRNGAWPEPEENGVVYLKVPVNVLGKK